MNQDPRVAAIPGRDARRSQMLTLTDSIRNVFGSAGRYPEDYVAEIRTNWREAEKDLRRTIGLVLLLAAIFQLTESKQGDSADGTGVSEIVLGFVKITDISLVRKVIPLVIAYLFYSIATLLSDIYFFSNVHRRAASVAFRDLATNHLVSALDPPNAFGVSFGRSEDFIRSPLINRGLNLSFWAKAITIVAAPLGFEVYAYYVLIKEQVGWPRIWDENLWGAIILIWDETFLAITLIIAAVIILGALIFLLSIPLTATGEEILHGSTPGPPSEDLPTTQQVTEGPAEPNG